MRESEFQKKFINKVEKALPNCTVLKNDSGYLQGIPDWSVLLGSKYALLEIKIKESAHRQPNQEYYINKCNSNGGFGRFVYPENEKKIIEEMIEYFNN